MSNKDTLRLIALKLDLPDLLNFCSSNKYTYENVCDETFWEMKLNKDFPGLWTHLTRKEDTKKKLYLFLKRILTKKNFKSILIKPYLINSRTSFHVDNFSDLYDLLYNINYYDKWGVIDYLKNYKKELDILQLRHDKWHEYTPMVLKEIQIFNDYILGPYRAVEGPITERRELLEKIINLKNADFMETHIHIFYMMNKFHNMILRLIDYPEMSLEEYIKLLETLEERLQNYIIENTSQNVMTEMQDISEDYLKGYPRNEYKNLYYNQNELEVLQMLHDAIRIGKLSIFDPVDYNYIMKKLRS